MTRKAHIMMIDDSQFDQMAVGRVMAKLFQDKIACIFRQGIGDALDQLNETQIPPDLILVDINLDDGNGLEFISHLKSIPELRLVPVVVFSSSSDPKDVRHAYERGASSYWTKPCKPQELEVGLRKLCEYWFAKPNRLPRCSSFLD